MPKLGEFIGALLSDAAQARVRADLEALKIAEAYSANELLRHLPVPRFRLPDITVDMPVLVAGVDAAQVPGRAEGPTNDEIGKLVRRALADGELKIPTAVRDRIIAAVAQRSRQLFEPGADALLAPSRVAAELSQRFARSTREALDGDEEEQERVQVAQSSLRQGLHALLLAKLARSPSLDVVVTAAEIKAHGNSESIVRIRLTVSEDAYEVVRNDSGDGFILTPE